MYQEEKILGAEFEVNAAITIAANEKIASLEQTVDYVFIYEMIKERMSVPTPLLETLAQELIESIYLSDKRILSININIIKKNPPISNFTGNVGVSLIKHFAQ
jgi:dihydroneopterin aldolase